MKKIRKRRRPVNPSNSYTPPPSLPTYEWADGEGFHFLVRGQAPTAEQLDEMTRAYRERLRSDPRWLEIVRQVGEAQAEELLQGCRVELRRG